MEGTVREFEEKAFSDLPQVEKKAVEILNSKNPEKEPFTLNQYLTKYTGDFARAPCRNIVNYMNCSGPVMPGDLGLTESTELFRLSVR